MGFLRNHYIGSLSIFNVEMSLSSFIIYCATKDLQGYTNDKEIWKTK